MKTVVLKCNCRSTYQDSVYGSGNRVHNLSPRDGNGAAKAYCTVCSGNGRMAKFNSKSNPPSTNRPFKTVNQKFNATKPE